MFRYRHTEKQYGRGKLSQKIDKCPFCHLEDKELNPKERRIIKETEHCWVMNAMFPYDVWEWRDVQDHLMVLPKRHVVSLSELTIDERAEILDIMCEFEDKGYDLYWRAPKSVLRSVKAHQHTHLIKTADKEAKGAIYWVKPYVLRKF